MSELTADGFNEHGVAMCQCKPFGPVHAWEPARRTSPGRVEVVREAAHA